MDFSSPWFTLILLGVGCYVLTFITRRIFETAFPKLKAQVIPGDAAAKGTHLEGMPTVGGSEVFLSAISRWWNQVILYALAPLWGLALVVMCHGEKFYPEEFKPWIVSILIGLVMGFFSGFCVKLLKKIFLDKVGATDEATLPSEKAS